MDDIESFRTLLADPHNAPILARWRAFVAHATARAAEKNIALSADDLVTLPSARIYAISGQWPAAADDWENEAKLHLPTWKAAAENAALRASLDNIDDPKHDANARQWASLSPQARMAKARESGMELPRTAEREKLSDEERSRLQKQLNSGMLRGSQKIAAARRLGLA